MQQDHWSHGDHEAGASAVLRGGSLARDAASQVAIAGAIPPLAAGVWLGIWCAWLGNLVCMAWESGALSELGLVQLLGPASTGVRRGTSDASALDQPPPSPLILSSTRAVAIFEAALPCFTLPAVCHVPVCQSASYIDCPSTLLRHASSVIHVVVVESVTQQERTP
jgi:hypothetical protein